MSDDRDQRSLSPEMARARSEIEDGLLRVPYVDFVSVAFSRKNTAVILVTIGSSRPDLVVALMEPSVFPVLASAISEHLLSGTWVPEIQVLKGRTREK